MSIKAIQSTKRAWSGRKRERALRPGSRTHLGRGGQSANSVKLYKISSWEPEEASFNLPCLLILAPSWMLGLPSPTRPSWRRRRGGHCANRPFCHSDGARDGEERITWRCATKRSASGLLRDALQPFLGAGEVGRAGVEGWKLAGRFEPPWIELSEVWVPGWTYFHNSDKEFALTMGGGCGMLEGGRHGAGEGYKEPEGGREADSPTKYPNELIKIYKD